MTTLGKLKAYYQGKQKLDLSGLRVVVIDEADFFFEDENNNKSLMQLHAYLQKLELKYQYVLFSATYPEEVSEKISEIVKEANQISLKVEQLKLDHI